MLEGLANAYKAGQRPDDALKYWQQLYDTAVNAGFVLAAAEASGSMAEIYNARKDYGKAVVNYSLAADAWHRAGNEQRRAAALTSQASMLFIQGRKDEAAKLDEVILPLAKATKNLRLQFTIDLAIAECLDGTAKNDRVIEALTDAESLLSPELTLDGIAPSLITELYTRLAAYYDRTGALTKELISLEKAMVPAIALATAQDQTKNEKTIAWLVTETGSRLEANHVREKADNEYQAGHWSEAFVFYALLQYFNETDAAWRGKYGEYTRDLSQDSAWSKLVQLPQKVIDSTGGAASLENDLIELGPIANRARLASFVYLVNYYLLHQDSAKALHYAKEAQPYLNLGLNDKPGSWDALMACDLAYTLMLQKELAAAVDSLGPCLTIAKKLDDPNSLGWAHQTNVWVLQAAGKEEQAQDSVRYLLQQKPNDPQQYVHLAEVRTQQGNRTEAAKAWQDAIRLFEEQNNWSAAAAAHIALANSPPDTPGLDSEERQRQFERAVALFREVHNQDGEVSAELSLAAYYVSEKKYSDAHAHYENALAIARRQGRKAYEAEILSTIGRTYEVEGDITHANANFEKSADIYRNLGEVDSEALQWFGVARTLDALHKPDDSHSTLLRAESLADKSTNWRTRYWIRRYLASSYGAQGDFQKSVDVMQEAKGISDAAANQPLASAWARLGLAIYLEIIGRMQDALDQVNAAIPVLKEFKDNDDLVVAYTEIMSIYGARESQLKDLNKALDAYNSAYQIASSVSPEKAILLDQDLIEIYWQMNRFKDAENKANEALRYYKSKKDEAGEAGALISLAENLRSEGDLTGASHALQTAAPLVSRAQNFYLGGRLLYGQANLYRSQGLFVEASDTYGQLIELVEQFKTGSAVENRRHVAETYGFIYDELIDTYYTMAVAEKGDLESAAGKAFEYAELNKARVFSSSWGLVFLDGLQNQVPADLREQEHSLAAKKATLQAELQNSLSSGGKKPASELKGTLDALALQESQLVEKLRKVAPQYSAVRYPQRVAMAHIPLREKELLIEFKVLQDAVLVWMVRGASRGSELLGFYKVRRSRQWFEQQIESVRGAFNSGRPENFDPQISEELFDVLFPGHYSEALTNAQEVIIIPDDVLFLLPLELLSPTAREGKYVLLSTATDYFPSTAAFMLSRSKLETGRSWREQFIGIGDPITSPDDQRYIAAKLETDFGTTVVPTSQNRSNDRGISIDRIRSGGIELERIPETATEIESIASLFSSASGATEIRTGVNATKKGLLQTDLSQFRFVHLATHGVLPVEASISEPALVFSYSGANQDEMLLYLSEVVRLKMNADMVVLSACNTGSGKIARAEGVASLGTAFLAAGASSVAVSLWQVSDNSTATFMQEFYRNLLSGKTKPTALAAARKALVAKGYENPFFWAPFVLTGE